MATIEEYKITGIEWRAKAPFKTWWLHIEHKVPESGPLKLLLSDLAGIGFIEGGASGGIKAIPALPLILDGVRLNLDLGKSGSDLFAMWTDNERRQFMRQAKDVFARHGIAMPTKRKMTLADMM